MSIKPRSAVLAAALPARPARRPPTQGQLSAAAYRLADELGGREISPADRDWAAGEIYGYAEKSVETAWSVVDAAIMAVKCFSGRRKISGACGDVVGPFLAALEKAKMADLASRDEILKGIKSAEGEAKAVLEVELRERLLRGAAPGTPLKLGEKASAFLVDAMTREFMPVEGSPLADKDFPRFVRGNVRLLDWLATTLLFRNEQAEAYAAAKATDKASRVAADSEPAPPAEEETPAAAEDAVAEAAVA